VKFIRKVLHATYPTYLILLALILLVAAPCDLVRYSWSGCKEFYKDIRWNCGKVYRDIKWASEAFTYSTYKEGREDVPCPSKDS